MNLRFVITETPQRSWLSQLVRALTFEPVPERYPRFTVEADDTSTGSVVLRINADYREEAESKLERLQAELAEAGIVAFLERYQSSRIDPS